MTAKTKTKPTGLLAHKGAAVPVGSGSSRLGEALVSPANDSTPHAAQEGSHPAAEILIVTDHSLNEKLYRDLLEARGHGAAILDDSGRLSATLRLTRPELVLIDLYRPRNAGLDAVREIKRDPLLRDIPVILITDILTESDEQQVRASGADGYLVKPISVAEFVRVVETASIGNSHPQARAI